MRKEKIAPVTMEVIQLKGSKFHPMLQAITAALLFGASAPIAKLLLGNIEPVPLAAFLYLGSGIGLLIFKVFQGFRKEYKKAEAGIKNEDIKWLFGSVLVGGIFAPIILMFSLKNTPASTTSLLQNFEGVSTTLIAVFIFKEAIGKRVWLAVAAITSASILLSWNPDSEWGFSIGALGVLLACVFWGLDNNFTRNISAKDPLITVIIKGIGAGSFSLLLAVLLHNEFPDLKIIIGSMLLGFFCYGLSIVLFILSMRNLGASRASAFLGTAPFAGALLSFLLLHELPNILFCAAIPIMIIGAVLLLGEEHIHRHIHDLIEHEHRHNHNDGHHEHEHEHENIKLPEHSHLHKHEVIEHTHAHTPEIHHRHAHK